MRLSYWWPIGLVVLLTLSLLARASSLDDNVIELFPKDVTQLAYVDLAAARQFLWFAQFQQQTLPPTVIALEQFLALAGIKPNTQVNQVVWARVAAKSGSSGPRVLKTTA